MEMDYYQMDEEELGQKIKEVKDELELKKQLKGIG